MFEATFKITALVESNAQGQRVFQVLKHEDAVDDDGLLIARSDGLPTRCLPHAAGR